MMRSVGTLTRADLAETINRKMGLSRAESLDMVEAKERIGRNPKTGVEVPITPRRVMTFRASQLLKERIANG